MRDEFLFCLYEKILSHLQGIFSYFDIFYCFGSNLKIACGAIFYPGKRVARS
jgi:hypothetical protein